MLQLYYNDQMADKILDVLREMGLSVPGDISLVSFDDSTCCCI